MLHFRGNDVIRRQSYSKKKSHISVDRVLVRSSEIPFRLRTYTAAKKIHVQRATENFSIKLTQKLRPLRGRASTKTCTDGEHPSSAQRHQRLQRRPRIPLQARRSTEPRTHDFRDDVFFFSTPQIHREGVKPIPPGGGGGGEHTEHPTKIARTSPGRDERRDASRPEPSATSATQPRPYPPSSAGFRRRGWRPARSG